MKEATILETNYVPSENIVAREIEGELIIVPLTTGIGDAEDELFTLNETGHAIWGKMDGKKSLREVIDELATEFEAPVGKIETDVTGLALELLRRNIIVPADDI